MYGGYHRLLWLFLCLHYLVCLCVVILQQTIIWNVFYVSSMLIGDIGMFWALQINNIHKGFELYQVTMHNLLCQSVPMFPLCILLTRRINIFWSESIDTFWPGAIGTVWNIKTKKKKKNRQYSQRFLQLHQLFMHNFLWKTVSKFPFCTLFTNYWNYLLLE